MTSAGLMLIFSENVNPSEDKAVTETRFMEPIGPAMAEILLLPIPSSMVTPSITHFIFMELTSKLKLLTLMLTV